MRGTMLTYHPGDDPPVVETLTIPPSLTFLQRRVGGYIQAVPRFTTIMHNGVKHGCVAYCDEEGKLKPNGRLNTQATRLWHQALPPPGLADGNGNIVDVLVGPVVILFGDAVFMRRL